MLCNRAGEPLNIFLHTNLVNSFFLVSFFYTSAESWLVSSSLQVETGNGQIWPPAVSLSYARCLGQTVLGFLSVAAAFLADLSDGFSFVLREFKSGWHTVKLKTNIRILCWVAAHPKNACGLVCVFSPYLHPRKWVLKCKNLTLLIILF